ncbi:hypothetical protein Rsub_04726 [Raphidocelis subcapitata]|uniref:Response regulatory domain-containing protein n=1 Tax=Raphidocelis subcapitata TaxID=307507 RepID=A0A2V0NZ99_9CHLO|nr:hypothetical protein Rsub_04726 [Raphidocelis subcapitata]|eukprot:GBF92002.1 hypothetical protein Rsub_04726 [Raphidocelis subcapitata]
MAAVVAGSGAWRHGAPPPGCRMPLAAPPAPLATAAGAGAEPSPAAARQGAAPAALVNGRQFPRDLRLLLIDADGAARRAVAARLAALGFPRVQEAASLADALRALRRGDAGAGAGAIDVVLADMRTAFEAGAGAGPAASGGGRPAAAALAAAAAAADAALVFMFMGDDRRGGGGARQIMTALNLGADDVLERPSDSQLQTIWTHAARREMRRLDIGGCAPPARATPRPAAASAPAPAAPRPPAAKPPPPPPPPAVAVPRRASECGGGAPGSPWGGFDQLLSYFDESELYGADLDAAWGMGADADAKRAAAPPLPPARPPAPPQQQGSLFPGAAAAYAPPLPLQRALLGSCSDMSCGTAVAPSPLLYRSASAPAAPSSAHPGPGPAPAQAPWGWPWGGGVAAAPLLSTPPPPIGCGAGSCVWGLPMCSVTAPGIVPPTCTAPMVP